MVTLQPNMAHNLQKPDPAGTKLKVKMSLFWSANAHQIKYNINTN